MLSAGWMHSYLVLDSCECSMQNAFPSIYPNTSSADAHTRARPLPICNGRLALWHLDAEAGLTQPAQDQPTVAIRPFADVHDEHEAGCE